MKRIPSRHGEKLDWIEKGPKNTRPKDRPNASKEGGEREKKKKRNEKE